MYSTVSSDTMSGLSALDKVFVQLVFYHLL